MKQENKTPPVASPCLSICLMEEDSGYCRGCFRTLDEITGWERFDNARKQQIVDALPARRERSHG